MIGVIRIVSDIGAVPIITLLFIDMFKYVSALCKPFLVLKFSLVDGSTHLLLKLEVLKCCGSRLAM